MSCQQFQSQLQAYHDGALSTASARELEAHLAQCSTCASELRSLRSMSMLLQSIPMAEISSDALARVHAAVDQTMDRSLLPLARSFVGIAASVLIAASAGLWLLRPDRASEPQPWEGAMLTSPNNETQTASNPNAPMIEPDLIVADLSRSSHR